MKTLAFIYPERASDDVVHMFQRLQMLVGAAGLEILSGAKVAVFGIGGVGSFAAEALARAAVGTLVLIDDDYIHPSNLNRQIHAVHSTLGWPKVVAMACRIQDINPGCEVKAQQEYFCSAREAEFLAGGYDYVLDAIDSVEPKVGLIAACLGRGIPIISCMGTGNRFQPVGFQVVDISKTYNDPLARIVRRRLRAQGITRGLKVVFSPELPRRVPGQGAVGQPTVASTSFVPSVAGLVMAGFVVNELLAAGGLAVGVEGGERG